MSAPLIWFVGNRNPSITENLVDENDAPIDLTGKTVRFRAREIGSATLLVDQPATVVGLATEGNVRYDWSAADIDPVGPPIGILAAPRRALVWWEVTTTAGGRKQDYNEAEIDVYEHGPLAAYVELEEFKRTTSLTGQTYLDGDIQKALVAASRGIDQALHRRFYLDINATQVRYYTPRYADHIEIDDLVDFTSLKTDDDGDGTFETTWTENVDFVLEPFNAVAGSEPFTVIRARRTSSLAFPCYERSVELTAQFGWTAVPEGVKTLTTLVANRLIERTRKAPFGIINFAGDGAAVRAATIARDPEYAWLVEGLGRVQVLA